MVRVAGWETHLLQVQGTEYALGTESSLKLPIARQSAHFLTDGQVYTRDWSAERQTAAREQLGELLDQIARREFPPWPAYCRYCSEFRAICPYEEEAA
jgi:hypothetical protein